MIFPPYWKIFLLINFSLVTNSLHAQNSCTNSVMLPLWPAQVNVGNLSVPGDKITVEAMINRTTAYSGGPLYAGNIVSKHDTPGDANYLLRPNHAEITTSNGYFRTPDICEIKLNKTYHVAMVYDGVTLKFYRNGFLMSSVNATGSLIQNNWTTVIGSKYFPNFHTENFVGYINEVRIWNVTRTQNELRTYMNLPLPNPTTQSGLLAYYTFDNLINKQGNTAWNATLAGAAALNQTNPTCAAFVIDSCDAIKSGIDFTASQDICNPLSINFSITGKIPTTQKWTFGDGIGVSNAASPAYVYPAFGNYPVTLIGQDGSSSDTVTKMISVNDVLDDIVVTPDTTICSGSSKQIRTIPSLSFCWSPTTYLDNPNSANPVTSTPHDITYYFKAEVTGNNLISNGNFSAGNSGFISGYNLANPNVTEGQFFVGPNPKNWNPSLDNCTDHSSGNGNMMLVNGSPVADLEVWKQTIPVTPNTNYAFSTWIQALWSPNPAQLQFSINGISMGSMITASLPTCTWKQFYTTWNSGNNTSATISIVNKNTIVQGNDFALDDISFAPVFIKHDSVKISVEKPVVKTNNDTLVCNGSAVPLNVSGGASFSWLPTASLDNANSNKPIATVQGRTEYIVTGTTANGCKAKDSVVVNVYTKPFMNTSNDTMVCTGAAVQLSSSGGLSYRWSPVGTLNNANLPNPVATPLVNTKYSVQVTDGNGCNYTDSVSIAIRARPVFAASKDTFICEGSTITLHARGGNNFLWSSTGPISNPSAPDLLISPTATTTYSVQISETICNYDTVFNVQVSVNPNPLVTAVKSNDIDCMVTTAQLKANGALTYQWTPSAVLDNPNLPNPIASIDSTTTFTVTGTNQFGCISMDTMSVYASKSGNPGFMMPNAFTPNNDGKNDCFGIRKWGNVKVQEFSIFNRWGERIFTTKNPQHCWDGRYNGVIQDSGGYVYIIKARSFCGDIVRKGMVMLIN